MPADRTPGAMDNPYYGWSPLVTREPLRWPEDARVALCVIVTLGHVEWLPPENAIVPPSATRVGPYPEVPDIHETSPHEYGTRVGVFRVMDVLARHGIRATVAMDAAVLASCPYLVDECQRRGWEFVGHGTTSSRMITEAMTEADEREYIRSSLDAVRAATGKMPAGWVGVDYGESTRTVRLLAEMGVRYVCDWPNDEQPYRMTVPTGSMVSLPVTLDLDDVLFHHIRTIPIRRFAELITESFDVLHEEGAETGRLLVLNLHPFVIGQPYRISHLDRALEHITRHEGVWVATGSEIVDWFSKT